MRLYEALQYLDIKTKGYGDDFVIVDWYDFDTIRESLAGLVDLSIVNNSNKDKGYLLKYNIQNEEKIIKKLIEIYNIYLEIKLNIDKYVRFDKEKEYYYYYKLSNKRIFREEIKRFS